MESRVSARGPTVVVDPSVTHTQSGQPQAGVTPARAAHRQTTLTPQCMDGSLGTYKYNYRSKWTMCTLPWLLDFSSRTKYLLYNSTSSAKPTNDPSTCHCTSCHCLSRCGLHLYRVRYTDQPGTNVQTQVLQSNWSATYRR
ncbi:hypothetical protein CAAN3_15S03950 [[Candida] anglica]